ncbi:helix-turn-helix domain-containing protein [Geodermatophilus sp. SYSU D00691]
MADENLPALVRRRMTELDLTPEQASRLARWAVSPQTIGRLAADRHRGPISERLAVALAAALGVPENRVRRLAGLPEVPDARVDVETAPHLRLIRGGG